MSKKSRNLIKFLPTLESHFCLQHHFFGELESQNVYLTKDIASKKAAWSKFTSKSLQVLLSSIAELPMDAEMRIYAR